MRKALSGALAAVGLVAMLVLPSAGLAGKATARPATSIADTQHASLQVESGILPISTTGAQAMKAKSNSTLGTFGHLRRAAADPPIGTVKTFLILDDFFGIYRLANFTLRGTSTHAVAWVQNTATFPAGDCRNNFPDRIQVTDAQVNYLLNQFDTNIWPKEADAFSIAPPHDGSNAILPGLVGLQADYYAGDGRQTDILLSHVRDTQDCEPT